MKKYILFWMGVNLIKTLIFNFRFFSFKDAIKFPVIIRGPFKLKNKDGRIKTLSKVHFNMLQLGISDVVRSYDTKSLFCIRGELIIGDNVTIRRGMRIEIKKGACVVLDNNVYIGDCCTIISAKNIHIKEATRIGNNTTFMDTDFHYVINTKNKEVKKFSKEIEIGENNWIGGNCIIKKGAKTPKGTILAGPYSMISKNYIGLINDYSLIAGSPAKLIVENMRRINNTKSEKLLNEWYYHHDETFVCDEDIDNFCMPSK